MLAVDRDGGRKADRPRRIGERAHGQQHALDVGVDDDRRGLACRHAWPAALLALTCVGDGLLGRGFGNPEALKPDGKARIVHHGEHAGHAAVLVADQIGGGAAIVAEHHGAGG